MKIARLDHILQQLGYVTYEQIQVALRRQKAYSGRIGTHLLHLKCITEEQLAHALSIQYEIPGFIPDMHPVSPETTKQLPLEFAEKYQMLPMKVQSDKDELSLIVADPGDQEAIEAVQRHFKCSHTKLYVAPESMIKKLIVLYHKEIQKPGKNGRRIKLPELFDGDSGEGENKDRRSGTANGSAADPVNVLMITRTNFLKNYLVPIFEREGFNLNILSEKEEFAEILQKTAFEHILVSHTMAEEFNGWMRQGKLPSIRAEISKYSSISSALMDNPVPYHSIVHALHQSLEIVAEIRRNEGRKTPPYHCICKDVQQLAELLGLKRIAVDGLRITALLLVPKGIEDIAPLHDAVNIPYYSPADVDAALVYAHSLGFPWNIEDTLRAFRELFHGNSKLEESSTAYPEIAIASQVLALAWFRHTCIRPSGGTAEETLHSIRSELREISGRLARPEIVETYIRLIDQHRDDIPNAPNRQLFVVGVGNEITSMFATRLEHLGYRTVRISELEEAEMMCRRHAPSAVFIHDKSFPENVPTCKDIIGTEPSVLLYAITSENNPSYILELFDSGFDDVFAPPYDFSIIAARLDRSFKVNDRTVSRNVKPGEFTATFKAFAFIDLIQALGQSMKSVHIRLESGNGDTAEIYMDHGKVIHAVCGELNGVDAIYYIITWEEDSEFTVKPVEEFPTANITLSNESILMEGCRLLDESRV